MRLAIAEEINSRASLTFLPSCVLQYSFHLATSLVALFHCWISTETLVQTVMFNFGGSFLHTKINACRTFYFLGT